MSKITRREFMQISGVLMAGAHFLPTFSPIAKLAQTSIQGRALAPLTITHADGSAAKILLPDSVIPLLGAQDDRYATPGGFIPRALVQPMTVTPNLAETALPLPFIAEVVAPVAAVRASCAADAPLLARIGHAGTATVLSRLIDGRGGADWYEVDAGGLRGWSQSTLWSPAEMPSVSAKSRAVVIDRATQTLTVTENDAVFLQALVSVVPDAPALNATVSGRQPSGQASYGGAIQYSAPWQLHLDNGATLGGSYWHNRFGAATPGMLAQMPPHIAQWLYGALADGAKVTIQ
jgi:hypothetical protein